MKGFIACCLAALPEWAGLELRRPIHFALPYDEEVGCLGVPVLIENMLETVAKPQFALVGEPTDMRPATAHKGFCAGNRARDARAWRQRVAGGQAPRHQRQSAVSLAQA